MKCPGQDMQYWSAEAIYEVDCPKCGKSVEFYKDDTNRRCHHCGHRFVNPKMDFGCAAYCQYAEQCLGTLPEEFVGAQDGLLKDKVAVEMKRHFKSDFHSIGRAMRVARYAEMIGKTAGGNLAVLLCAAFLHNIGKTDTEHRDRRPAAAIAREILGRLKAKEQMQESVCRLLEEQHGSSREMTIEQQILADAKKLALLEESCKQEDSSSTMTRETSGTLHTGEARKLAEQLLADCSAS